MGCGCDERRRKLSAWAARFQRKVSEYLSAKEATHPQAAGVQAEAGLDQGDATQAHHGSAVAPGEGTHPRS